MDAKDILKKIRAVFDSTSSSTAAPAPIVPPAPIPQKLAANFPVDGGAPVYVDTTIDVGLPVFSDEAMTAPYPDGDYTVTGTDFMFSVAGGVVTVVSGTLVAAAPPVLPPPPMPAGPTIPQFEAMQLELANLKAALLKANLLAEKHEQILPDLFELAEKLTEIPVSAPKALNETQQEKYDYATKRDDRINQIAKTLKKIKN
jgi:hypothetical protein